ncbi:MAG: hypothetical protein AAGA17_13950 [Actinomycetota bacterium]
MTTRRPRVDPRARGDRRLRTALGAYAAAAVRGDAVDPVTTEVVRLRCAEHHDCHT